MTGLAAAELAARGEDEGPVPANPSRPRSMAMLLISLETPSWPESCASEVSGCGEELLPDESVTGLGPDVSGAGMNGVNNEAIGLSKAGQEGSSNVSIDAASKGVSTLPELGAAGTIIECPSGSLPWVAT